MAQHRSGGPAKARVGSRRPFYRVNFTAEIAKLHPRQACRKKGRKQMRGFALFVAGTIVGAGLAATTFAQSSLSPNRGIVAINHVALAVPDIEKAVEYYTKTMGFPEAFRVKNQAGQVQLVYVQVSQNTFIEIQSISADRPAGIYHFGVHVENIKAVTEMFKARGAKVQDIRPSSGTKAMLSNVIDPNGVRMELLELPADSLHRQAMDRWR
jgi:catechol 2,3-dioxygenase-like lactoylglutathione lyase family enzyme